MGHGSARWGSVTFVQRFGSSLNLNLHVHVLMLGGVYVDGKKASVFVPAPRYPTQMCNRSCRRVRAVSSACASQHGLLDDTQADPPTDEEPVLAALTAASVRGTIATGDAPVSASDVPSLVPKQRESSSGNGASSGVHPSQ